MIAGITVGILVLTVLRRRRVQGPAG
jgi:hypothetical protein